MIAGFVAAMPLYVLGLLSSYAATRFITTSYFGQSAGTYDHYFHLFLPPVDIFWSFAKVMVFAVVIILIHCYYGYTGLRRAGWRGRGGRQGSAHLERGHQHHRLLLQPGGLGRHHDGPDCRVVRVSNAGGGVLSRVGNHAYGVAFLLVIVLLAGLSVASFQKRFTPVVKVTLMAERIGSQLQNGSDVKIRELIVGEVRSVTTTGEGASI
jgi:hypothetical protein